MARCRRIPGPGSARLKAGVLALTTLALLGAAGAEVGITQRIVQAIADPNVAYVLFTIGVLGLLAELASPGLGVPGTIGAIALVLAFVAFGALPVSGAGVLLMLLALGLFITELYTAGFGLAAGLGLLAFVLGSLLLFGRASPVEAPVRVSRWLIAVNATVLGAFFIVVVRALLRARRVPVSSGSETLIGRTGVALTDLAPAGRVRVDGEVWSALAEDDLIRAGEQVQVLSVQGVTLRVIRALSRADFMDESKREVRA